MSDAVGELLLLITEVLLLPVLLLLLGLWGLSLLYLGGFLGEAVRRWRCRVAFRAFVCRLRREVWQDLSIDAVPPAPGLLAQGLAEFRRSPRSMDKLADDLQLRAEALLGRLHICLRLGPMLGLAGTLIPLGPALRALAEGDTGSLATQLIIAFATTVVGLWIGGLCFVMHSIRQRWYNQDISDFEFVLKHLRQQQRRIRNGRREPCASAGA